MMVVVSSVGAMLASGSSRCGSPYMSEIIFEVHQDEVDGGYTASALGFGIHTQGDTLEELRAMVKDAVACYFDDSSQSPKISESGGGPAI